jgi:hypothetical protein
MKRLALLAAMLFASTLARTADAQQPATADPQAAAAAFLQGRALMLQQIAVVEALRAYARDPNASAAELEAMRKAWLTNGGAVMTVPSTGERAPWYSAGGDVLSMQPPSSAPLLEPSDAGPSNDAGDASDASAEPPDAESDAEPEGGLVPLEPDARVQALATPSASPSASAAASGWPSGWPEGAATSGSPPIAPPESSEHASIGPANEAHTDRTTLHFESRDWLIAPAGGALVVFAASLLLVRRVRSKR